MQNLSADQQHAFPQGVNSQQMACYCRADARLKHPAAGFTQEATPPSFTPSTNNRKKQFQSPGMYLTAHTTALSRRSQFHTHNHRTSSTVHKTRLEIHSSTRHTLYHYTHVTVPNVFRISHRGSPQLLLHVLHHCTRVFSVVLHGSRRSQLHIVIHHTM